MDILHKAFVIPLLLGSHIVTAVYKELGLTDSFFFPFVYEQISNTKCTYILRCSSTNTGM